MARRLLVVVGVLVLVAGLAGPALACGGLVSPNGTANLLRTSTLAAYHSGEEHYITSFEFAGVGGGKFGSIVPLPGIPRKVERGGRWTLQRLVREVQPVTFAEGARLGAPVPQRALAARVILETRIDALDITVLEGGARGVAEWATDHGFELSPDAPEVLEFYAERSPIFMAARFDAAEAARRGQTAGDGTPIHLTIPTPDPWVPLRILGLGKRPVERIQADVFLLTDRAPSLLPVPKGVAAPKGVPAADGLILRRSGEASAPLLRDLRSDKGMGWVHPDGHWLTYLTVDSSAKDLTFDLAIDESGKREPSWVAAGLVRPAPEPVPSRIKESIEIAVPVARTREAVGRPAWLMALALALAAAATGALWAVRRRA